jgi:hypothetical protein
VGQEIFAGDYWGELRVYSRAGALLRTFTGAPYIYSLAGGLIPDGSHRVQLALGQTVSGRDFATKEPAPPVALGDAYSTAEDTPLVVSGPGVLANDADANGDVLSAVFLAGPANGTLSLNGGGGFTHPIPTTTGADRFTYQPSDVKAPGNVQWDADDRAGQRCAAVLQGPRSDGERQ